MKQEDPQFRVRMPIAIKCWVEQQAAINHRSLNKEICFRIEQAMLNDQTPATGADLGRNTPEAGA